MEATTCRHPLLGKVSRNEVEVTFYVLATNATCEGVDSLYCQLGGEPALRWVRDDTTTGQEGYTCKHGPLTLGIDNVSEPERLIVRWAWYVDGGSGEGGPYVYDYALTREAAMAAALAAVPECVVLAVAECLGMVPRG